MTPDQQAAIEVVQEDLKSVIKYLTKPTMTEVQGVEKAIEHVKIAQAILDSILLHSGDWLTQAERAQEILAESDDDEGKPN